MKQYLQVFSLSWQNALVYRTNLLFWRVRQMLGTLLAITLWGAIYQSNGPVLGYSSDQMFTYIFLAAIMQNIIIATALHDLPHRVYSGELSLWLVRPIALFRSFLARDLADKSLNIVFIVVETVIFYLLIRPVLIQPEWLHAVICFVWIILGIGIHFFIELLFGALGFWSPEVWGPKFLFFTMVELGSGRLFPLDIMPRFIQSLLYATPFPYLGFAQTQAYLGNYDAREIAINSIVMVGWLLGLGLAAKYIWKRGLRDYTAMGG